MDNQYQAPEAPLADQLPLAGSYGGFGVRLVASLIDSILIGLLTWALIWAVVGINSQAAGTIGSVASVFSLIFYYGLPLFITVGFWIYKSATPGKMLFGMRIVDANTLKPASKGRLILRYIGYYVSMLVLGLGFLWMIWDKRKQGWHDKIAGTVVIRD